MSVPLYCDTVPNLYHCTVIHYHVCVPLYCDTAPNLYPCTGIKYHICIYCDTVQYLHCCTVKKYQICTTLLWYHICITLLWCRPKALVLWYSITPCHFNGINTTSVSRYRHWTYPRIFMCLFDELYWKVATLGSALILMHTGGMLTPSQNIPDVDATILLFSSVRWP